MSQSVLPEKASGVGSRGPDRRPTSTWRPELVLPAIPIGALVLVLALQFSGAAKGTELSDPGAFTRWALPFATLIHHSAMAITIGALVFAATVLPRSTKPHRARKGSHGTDGGEVHPAFARTMNIAAGAAMVWTLAAVAVLILTFSDVAGLPLSADAAYTDSMKDYILNISLGQAWAWMIVIAAVVSSLAFVVRSPVGVALSAVFSLFGIIPLSLIGHSAGGDDHWGAVNGILLHLLGLCIWVGGIVVLACVAPLLHAPAPGKFSSTRPVLAGVVLQRFSALATLAFFVVFASGVVSAMVRMDHWSQLLSGYGGLVMIKAVLTLVLGVMGLGHRRWVIPKLMAGKLRATTTAWRIVAGEVILMAAVMALGTALSRTAPPVPEELPPKATPARILTGYDLPPELTSSSWLTVWRMDWLWLAVAIFLAVAYIQGIRTLRRRGDSWSVMRTVAWFVGLIALVYITSGAPAVYGVVLFSMHMVGHMALTMVAPFFLVLGTPMTLALKAIPARGDGTRGPREWLLAGIHSRFSKLVTHPLFAAANFAGSIVLFYATDAFRFALAEHSGHELMNLHFLLTGYIFALNMIDGDPLPRRAPYPMRLVILLATMSFHAFYGVSIMGSESLMQASWFGNMGREWGPTALADQKLGAGAMWGIGEVPTLMLALGVVVTWNRADSREAVRRDRQADRNNEADLAAYNQMFAQLKEQDRRYDSSGR